MADDTISFELLKKHTGLIHRQPCFVSDNLSVDSYHFAFLDKQGQLLDDDSEVPIFLEQLSNLLPMVSSSPKALLSMPESWRNALIETQNAQVQSAFDFVINVFNGDAPVAESSSLSFARHASLHRDSNDSSTLLIDMDEFNAQDLIEHLTSWRDRHAFLCATNVNSFEQLAFCQQQEFTLLQGKFYTQISETNNKKASPSIQILMELLVKLQDPDITAEELANTINLDPSLGYKLLRLINSAFFGLPKEINSVKQAVVMLGHNKIKIWASLLSLSNVDDKPKELRVIAMIRAKMCELLAKYYKGQAETFFAAGLFSSLDAIIDKPLTLILEDLPLSPELNAALSHNSGAAGKALLDVLNYERADWKALETSLMPAEILARAYIDAVYWAKELNSQLV